MALIIFVFLAWGVWREPDFLQNWYKIGKEVALGIGIVLLIWPCFLSPCFLSPRPRREQNIRYALSAIWVGLILLAMYLMGPLPGVK